MGIFGSKFQPFLKKTKAETTPLVLESQITFIFFSLFFLLISKREIFPGIFTMRVNMKKEEKMKEWQGKSPEKNVVMKLMA